MKKSSIWMSSGLLIFLFIYGAWVFVAANRVPTIAVDYVKEINSTAARVPAEDRAWPHYRMAGIKLRAYPEPVISFEEHEDSPEYPLDEGWAYYQEWLDSHQDTLDFIRLGASKSGMGFIASGKIAEEDKELWPDQYESQQAESSEEKQLLLEVLLPQLSHHRAMSRLLAYDIKASAHLGDSRKCKDDIDAMVAIATHIREHPLLLNDLISLSTFNLLFSTMSEIFSHEPMLFDAFMLEEIKNKLITIRGLLDVRFTGERYFMLDLLQRIYTDNGNGDGLLIPIEAADNLAMLEMVSNTSTFNQTIGFLPAVFSPILDIVHPPRKEVLAEYDRRLGIIESKRGLSLFKLSKIAKPFLETTVHSGQSPLFNKHFLIDLLMPALDKPLLASRYTHGYLDGVIATIYAIQTYQLTGFWPTSLEDAGVLDEWSGEPLLILHGDTHPIIYSVGSNQKDDGGIHNRYAKKWSSNEIYDGDWVMWPQND